MIKRILTLSIAIGMLTASAQAQNYRAKLEKVRKQAVLPKKESNTETKVEKSDATPSPTSTSKGTHDQAFIEKYDDIKAILYQVDKYLTSSSYDGFDEFLKALLQLDSKGYTLARLDSMVNDPKEQAQINLAGTIRSRTVIKDAYLPGIRNALDGKEGEHSLKMLEDKISEVSGNIAVATANGPDSEGKAKEIKDVYTGLLLFQKFCNNHKALETMVTKSKYYHNSVQTANDKKYAAYRSGDFHKKHGSGIYFVQRDGVTAKTLTDDVVTNKLIIDGKMPVHIFVLTDLGLGSYGSFLQFDLVDEGKSTNQNKYVFDARKMIPLTKSEQELGSKKLVFVPSASWGDIGSVYTKSMFYSGSTQRRLANALVPGVPQKFTIYSADSKLQTTVTIEATAEGIQFLKQMEASIEKYAIDAARMEKAEVSNPGLEAKIKKGFIANSQGKVVQVNRVVITSKPWFIKRNALGAVVYKDFYAQVAFKKADGNYYIQKVRCVSNNVNGVFQPIKVYGSGSSYQIRLNNINK